MDSACPPGFLPCRLCGPFGHFLPPLRPFLLGLPQPLPVFATGPLGVWLTATTQVWGSLTGFHPARLYSNLPYSCPGLNQAAPLPCKSRRGPRKAFRPLSLQPNTTQQPHPVLTSGPLLGHWKGAAYSNSMNVHTALYLAHVGCMNRLISLTGRPQL